MRAIGLWQPWAQLVVDGVKAVETRGRPIRTLVGERVAIHATMKLPVEAGGRALIAAGLPDYHERMLTLPRGALLGTVDVIDCLPITRARAVMTQDTDPREYALGDYRTGRWALRLANPRPFELGPLEWRGSQGVFMVPDEVIAARYDCRCDVRGFGYDDVTTDPLCWFHGDGGRCWRRSRLWPR